MVVIGINEKILTSNDISLVSGIFLLFLFSCRLSSFSGYMSLVVWKMHRGYHGKGKGNNDRQFRQPNFNQHNGAGRGSNMTAPAWQTRDGRGFGSFDGAGMSRPDEPRPFQQYGQDRNYAPSMTDPISVDELASPARDSKGRARKWNFMESGNNKPTSRSELEAWIQYNCERSFSGDRNKVDTMCEFFLSSKSASSAFRYLQRVRGPKYFGTYSNYLIAFDQEQISDGLHDYVNVLKDALYPDSGDRPLKNLEISVPDFPRSAAYDNVMTRQFRSNSEFCGGSKYYDQKIEDLRQARRKNPQMKKPENADVVSESKSSESSTSVSTSVAGTGSGLSDVIDIEQNVSPELSKAQMKKMLLALSKKLMDDEDDKDGDKEEEDGETSGTSNRVTRSSEKSANKKQKRSK